MTKHGLRALVGLAGLTALATSAGAQSRQVFGYAGVLGEWEIVAAVAAEPPEIYIPACGVLCDVFWWARRDLPAEQPAPIPEEDETP